MRDLEILIIHQDCSKYYGVRMEFIEIEMDKEEQLALFANQTDKMNAANLQPVRLLVVQEKEGLDKISKATNIYNAPLAIIVCSDHSIAWKRPFDNKQTTDIDASIVTDHMMLEATELGLGTVWVCYFKPYIIKEEFDFLCSKY